MSQNKEEGNMMHLGKKKRQKIIEGAGFFLSMLRQSESEPPPPFDEVNKSRDCDNGAEISQNYDDEAKDVTNDAVPSHSAELDEINVEIIETVVETEISTEIERIPFSENDSAPIIKAEVCISYVNYDFENSPTELLCEWKEFSNPFSNRNNFLKGCKWSPDGCSLLTNSDDRNLRVFSLPDQFYYSKFHDDSSKELKMMNKISNGDLVYDFCWYPFVSHPNTHCTLVASTCRDHPIHVWDIAESKILSSFTAINHLDELTTAHSLAFSLDGRKLYSGYKNCIRVFDFCRPGRQIETKDTRGENNLRCLSVGQNGIVSCFAMCPTYPGVYVCGSYNKTLALYSDELKAPQCVFQGHSGGVTHVAYHPNGNYFYSGSRKDNELICWDTRNLGSVLFSFERFIDTNQRIYFDIDKNGRYLISGNCDGQVRVWDLENSNKMTNFTSNKTCVNGISFNPFLPILATSSGQRTFKNVCFDDEIQKETTNKIDKCSENVENCIKLWLCKTDF